MKPNHKYRVSVYLGKDLYNELEEMGNAVGLSVATMAKIILTTGKQVADSLDRKDVMNYGKQLSKDTRLFRND